MKRIAMIAALTAALAVSGCGLFSKKPVSGSDAGAADAGVVEYGSDGPNTTAAGSAQGYPGPVEIGGIPGAPATGDGSTMGSGGLPLDSVIYFEYDSSSLTAAGMGVAAAYGRYLSENSAARLRLEGHTDERGTREYNIGLGERRANAVQDVLLAKGASASQLSIISYGEERPVSSDQSEQGWSQNRRVQIVKQ